MEWQSFKVFRNPYECISGDYKENVLESEIYRKLCPLIFRGCSFTYNQKPNIKYTYSCFLFLGEFFLFYEPQKDYWGFLTPMTVPRIQGLAAVYKDSIYYIAGTCGNHQRMFTVEAYDIELNKWTRKKDFPCDQSINPYLKLVLFQNKLHLFVRATQVTVEEHVFRTSRKNSLYQYDDIADQWMKVYETPDRLWDLGRHFECAVAKLYPQCLQKVL